KAQHIVQAQRGISILEIMLVVGLVGLIAALAVPNFNRLVERSRLNGEGRSLYSAFLSAQGEAMRRGSVVRLTIDGPQGEWRINEADRDDPAYPAVDGQTITRRSVEVAGVGFGPVDGMPSPYPAPYNTINNTTWCTFCAGDVGVLLFSHDGTFEIEGSNDVM